MEKALNKKEQKALEDEQRKPMIENEHEFKQIKEMSLESHFSNIEDIPSRNSAILKALDDGYTQGEVSRYLGLSTAMVSKVFRSMR